LFHIHVSVLHHYIFDRLFYTIYRLYIA
jgi:hypothetical protein